MLHIAFVEWRFSGCDTLSLGVSSVVRPSMAVKSSSVSDDHSLNDTASATSTVATNPQNFAPRKP